VLAGQPCVARSWLLTVAVRASALGGKQTLDAVRAVQEDEVVMEGAPMAIGHCLCGAVSFEVAGELPAPDGCHCTICRRQSGHYWAATEVPRSAVTIRGEENVTWFRSSETVRRGFCRVCGSVLFFDPAARSWIAIAMGAFEKPTGTWLGKHVFTADKGDYYDIADGLPQHAR
jgi:hypothetical protein